MRHIASPGEVTITRLARRNGSYWLAIAPAEFLDLGDQAEEKAAATQVEWPHAFARLRVPADKFLAEYDSNHCHAIYGNWIEELVWVAKILGIEYRVFQ